jgi:hypothetical protein
MPGTCHLRWRVGSEEQESMHRFISNRRGNFDGMNAKNQHQLKITAMHV